MFRIYLLHHLLRNTYPLPRATNSSAVVALTCILLGAPLLSIRDAVLTVYRKDMKIQNSIIISANRYRCSKSVCMKCKNMTQRHLHHRTIEIALSHHAVHRLWLVPNSIQCEVPNPPYPGNRIKSM